eukprot:CAMPEP_0173378528 /NCGR_PEP_ID=MMETSP1356-20130122/1676_1 /TAXON_ID=77927 ORGANISM="Hemiselmis virescens, Strain PCC157" /NCGR_SAMPLE_ID=MMETSP1356 /ASSEMBLY_ACC=CAM_ASM_000847 /LENGTH=132 /DNA_ID=CAMNT_0014331617 /DNA_START=26 /DNA_END=424 /DNA_ORIENTATION=-
MVRAIILLGLLASASAFTAPAGLGLRPSARPAVCKSSVMMSGYSPVPSPEGQKETYWETKAPASEVLGIGKDVTSEQFLLASVLAVLIGAFSLSQAVPLKPDPNPLFIAGSFMLPYSWALHVAAWIQKNNGK